MLNKLLNEVTIDDLRDFWDFYLAPATMLAVAIALPVVAYWSL